MTAALNWYRAMDHRALADLEPVAGPGSDATSGRLAARRLQPQRPQGADPRAVCKGPVPSSKCSRACRTGCPRTNAGPTLADLLVAPPGLDLRLPAPRFGEGPTPGLCENGPVRRFDHHSPRPTSSKSSIAPASVPFAEEKVAPNAAEADRNAEFPWKSFEACKAMELPALGIPEAYGGSGADSITQAIAVEELSRVCASTALILLINKLSMIPVMNWASEEPQAGLPAAGRQRRDPGRATACPSRMPAVDADLPLRTRAVRDGDDYILTGTKYWISNAGISDVYVVFAKTDPDAGARGVSCFLVERWGVHGAQARGQARYAGAARLVRSRWMKCACPHHTGSVRRGRASASPCTPWTGAVRVSGRKRSASRKAPSTSRVRI